MSEYDKITNEYDKIASEYNKITKSISKIQTDLAKDLLSAGYITGIIAGIIGFILLIIELKIYYKIHNINSWPIIKNGGIIRESFLENTTNGTTFSILLLSTTFYNLRYRTRTSFQYTINGKTYISDKLSYYEPWESNPVHAKIEYDLLQRGTMVDIRVNPLNPSEAYIYNKPYNQYIYMLLGLFLSIIGLYVIYKMFKK